MKKRTAIVGKGLSGEAAARLLALDAQNDFVFFDDKKTEAEFKDPQALLTKYQPSELLVSPGYPLSTPWIKSFVEGGGKLSSELSLATSYLSTEKVFAVTGSLGKSTTVGLLGAAAAAVGPAFVGGNFGVPLAQYVADLKEGKISRAENIILELSSYQLENYSNLKSEISAFTYLSSNHLERYATLSDYYETKWKLADRTRGTVVYNLNGGDLVSFVAAKKNPEKFVGVSANKTFLKDSDFARSPLLGAHNADNIAVAAEVARRAAWDIKFLEGLLSFGGLPHRLESFGTFGGVHFVNDSKATAMESVLTAARSVARDPRRQKKLHLLLGGRDKKLPWEKLAPLASVPGLVVHFFGEVGELAQQKSQLGGKSYPKLADTVRALSDQVQAGDFVLLSPGGTSLDEFKNFEDRGLSFKQMVRDSFSA